MTWLQRSDFRKDRFGGIPLYSAFGAAAVAHTARDNVAESVLQVGATTMVEEEALDPVSSVSNSRHRYVADGEEIGRAHV